MNAACLLAHYERIADAPEAVARLRRFILDLAVRGKLVAQDPKDEPASELLKRIAADKARLVRAGEIKQEKSPKPANPSGLPFESRTGWQAATIEQVLIELQTGPFGSSLHQSDYQVGGIPVVNPASIQNEQIVPLDKMAVGATTLERLSTFKLRAGDIVMGRRGEMGRCAIVTDREAGWLCGTGSLVLRLPKLVFGRFFVLLIGSPYVRDYLAASAVGATMQNLNQGILLSLVVGLPPLAEQHRIVSKVDELMALCDRLETARAAREATRDRLAESILARLNAPDSDTFQDDARFALDNLAALTVRPDQISRLRQIILNLAIRGKLVPQDPNDEPGSELLKHLVAQRAAMVRRGDVKPSKKLEPLKDAFLCSAPPSWVWVQANDLWDFENGDRSQNYPSREQLVPSGIPFVNAGHLVDGKISMATMNFITPEKFQQLAGGKLRKGDQVYCLRGSLGKHASYDHERPAAIASSLVILRPIEPRCAGYLSVYLSSDIADLMLRRFDNGSAQPNLSSANLRKYEVPLPPLAEQHRIVAKVDELMALCDQLERSLVVGAHTRRRLLDALLAEASAPAGRGAA